MFSQGRIQQDSSYLSNIYTPGLHVGFFSCFGLLDGGGRGETLSLGNYFV